MVIHIVDGVFYMCFATTVQIQINFTGNYNLTWIETNKKIFFIFIYVYL